MWSMEESTSWAQFKLPINATVSRNNTPQQLLHTMSQLCEASPGPSFALIDPKLGSLLTNGDIQAHLNLVVPHQRGSSCRRHGQDPHHAPSFPEYQFLGPCAASAYPCTWSSSAACPWSPCSSASWCSRTERPRRGCSRPCSSPPAVRLWQVSWTRADPRPTPPHQPVTSGITQCKALTSRWGD